MSRPTLNLKNLSPVSEGDNTPVSASPARGRETRTALLQKLRPPPLVHAWEFWHEKPQDGTPASNPSALATVTAADDNNAPSATGQPSTTATAKSSYDTNLSLLHSVTDVRTFWTLFNNFSFSALPPRTSVHLFHKSVLPAWEHPRNAEGGAWTFRLPHASASAFFRSLALLAIGEQLQEAVTVDPGRLTFRDDICGISFVVKSARTTAVQVWNRDAANEDGIREVLECVLQGVPEECKPSQGQYYYKRHKDHAGFNAKSDAVAMDSDQNVEQEAAEAGAEQEKERSQEVSQSVRAVEQEYEKVRKILEEVKVSDAEIEQNLTVEAGAGQAEAVDGKDTPP